MAAPKLPKAMRDVLSMQQRRLESVRGRSRRSMISALRESRVELHARLASVLGTGRRFEAHQLRVALVQVEDAMRTLGVEIGRVVVGAQRDATAASIRDTVAQIRVASSEYGMSETPLPLPEVRALVDRNSLLREVELERAAKGGVRYGLRGTLRVEKSLVQSMLMNESTDQAVARVLGTSPWLSQRYQAERLVRTEFSFAYNAGQRIALDHVAAPDDGLWLMWHEHAAGPEWAGPEDKAWSGEAIPLDKRVGDDSLRLHGQLRRPGEMFVDPGTGQEFPHPPNRPNDRAALVLMRPGEAYE